MNEWNQAPPDGEPRPGGDSHVVPDPAAAAAPPAGETDRALAVWFLVLAAGGAAFLLLGRPDAAALLAVAGQFVAARCADREPRWTLFNAAFQVITPLAGAATFAAIATIAWSSDLPAPARTIALGWAIGAAAISLLLATPLSGALATALFRVEPPTRVQKLAGRLVLLGFLLPVPLGLLSKELFDALESGAALIDATGLVCTLIGQVVLALAAVGFLIERDWRQTLARLGLGPLSPGALAAGLVALVVMVAMNAGLERAEARWFPPLWAADQEATALIVRGLSFRAVLLLGVSAGVGEEITVRGALQPRLGLLPSSLLFAALHVQYTWFGMATVALIGLVLGLLRRRTNTTTAIVVHATYDVIAAAWG